MSKPAAPAIKAWDTAVELSHVTKSFVQRQHERQNGLKGLFHKTERRVTALQGVNLRVRRGEFAAYAGPNGAGKSTTFKLLCGLIAPDQGTVTAMGLDPQKERIPLMRKTGVLFGGRAELWWDHPVMGSFEWKRDVWDIPYDRWRENVRFYAKLLDLEPFLYTFARELSLGQRMRAELALLLLSDPELILLDEPTLGLDVLAKRRMIECLRTLNRDKGVTILVTSHDMDDLTRMARRLILLDHGRIAFDGQTEELLRLTGDKRVLTLTRSGGPPRLSCATLIDSREGRHRYAFSGPDASRVLQEASAVKSVQDIEMARAPIEDMIAGLYADWEKTSHDRKAPHEKQEVESEQKCQNA